MQTSQLTSKLDARAWLSLSAKLQGLDSADLDAVEGELQDAIDARCGLVRLTEVAHAPGCFISDSSVGCLYWIQNITMTFDLHWLAKGTPAKAHFPKKEYYKHVLGAMQKPVVYRSEYCQSVYIAKTREMGSSWLACAYVAWLCQWRPHILFVVQATKEAKAAELVDYARTLWMNQPDWLKERHPLTTDNTMELIWANGSRMLGIPAGEDQVRMLHPWGILFDEAAFLPEFNACVNTVVPVAKQVLAISSAAPGPFAEACSSSQLEKT